MFKAFDEHSKSNEFNCWDQIEALHVVPVNKFISSIDVDIKNTFRYAVVTETEIKIYSFESTEEKPISLGHFKDASCAKFRSDGNMIIIGTKSGHILLLSPKMTGKILKSIQAHSAEITRIEYLHKYDPIQKLSVSISEDGTMQIWDVVTNQRLHLFAHSKEPLRGLAVTKANPELIATGSLDGIIRIYNLSGNNLPVLEVNTQMQVNCLMFPFESNFDYVLSAGKSTLSMWNISKLPFDKDDKPVPDATITPHHMQITDICALNGLNNNERVIFTAGLDGMVKVISLADFSELAKYEYPSSLMSVRVFPNCQYLVVGGNDMSDNRKCAIYTRKLKSVVEDKEKIMAGLIIAAENQKICDLTTRYCDANEAITVIKHISKLKPTIYEKLLRKHKHRALLNAMLNDRELEKKPDMFQYFIRQIENLGALKRTVAEHSDTKLNILLRYLKNCIKSSDYISTCMNVLNVISEIYPASVLVRQIEYVKLMKVISVNVRKYKKLEQVCVDVKDVLLSCESISGYEDDETTSNNMEVDDSDSFKINV